MTGSPPSSTPQGSPSGPPPPACPCEGTQDPRVVSNPPGLPHISYRVDDFTGFRRALLRPLDNEQSLGPWRPTAGDLGLQVLEWWAYLADILTFYNERIANETYLRTAQFPDSIAGLVDLLSYVPAPGLAARGQVGAVRSRARPTEALVVPAGMQISSTATPGVAPQTFEVDTAASFPGPSDVIVTLPPDDTLPLSSTHGPASVLLAGKVTAARPDDQLLLVERGWGAESDNWSLVTVSAVTQETDPGSGVANTRVAFTSSAAWGPPAAHVSPSGVAVRAAGTRSLILARSQRAWLRDQPSPLAAARTSSDYRLLRPTVAASIWNQDKSATTPNKPITVGGGTEGTPRTISVHLSAAVRGIQPGDLVLFDGGTHAQSVLSTVLGTSEQMWTVPFPGPPPPPPTTPGIVIAHTALDLVDQYESILTGYADVTAIAVRHGFRDVGTVIGTPRTTLGLLPATVSVPASFALPPGTATALIEDATGAGAVVMVAQTGNGELTLTAAPPAPSSFTPPLAVPLRLLFDLLAVSRGVTVASETLGSGNAALANQRFTLQKSPLTYLASGAGWTSTLEVYVDGILWSEVFTFFGQPPTAQVYLVERSPDLTAAVRFGDGVNGARLTSGNGNVAVRYRYGSGAASPPSGRLTTIVQRQPNLASIHNPIAVSGGADPQSPADVKANAPASVFTFGRAISARDYEVVAGQAPGVTRVRAYWTFDADEQRTLVKVYVNDDAGGVISASEALAGAEDPNRPVTVAAARSIDVDVTCTLVVAANRRQDDVVAAARAAISDPESGAFSPARMGIGQWLYRSQVEAALSVPGVVAVHNLGVTWDIQGPVGSISPTPIQLGDAADPGEGSFFDLLPSSVHITPVTSNA